MAGTGSLRFRLSYRTLGPAAFDWFFVKIDDNLVLRWNNADFNCLELRNRFNLPVPPGAHHVTMGVHQDGFGDPFHAEVSEIST